MNSQEKIAMLQLVIEEYEKAALKKASRSSIITTLNGPLSAMERVTNSSKFVVDSKPEDYKPEENDDSDLNFRELYNGFGNSEGGTWLEECMNCNLRPLAAWQMAPLEFVNPIKELLRQINAAIDGIEAAINDVGPISQICNLLNGMKGLTCPQDILLMIQALTLLFKLRAGKLLKIRLDWTAVLGPLLSVVFDVVGNIIGWVETLVMGILDCILGAIGTFGSIQEESGELAGLFNAYTQLPAREQDDEAPQADENPESSASPSTPPEEEPIDSNALSINTHGAMTGLEAEPVVSSDFVGIGDIDNLQGFDQIANAKNDEDTWAYPTGFAFDANLKLDQALQTPAWGSASWAVQLTTALKTTQGDVRGFLRDLKFSITSLKKLVGGSIALQIQATQTLLYLTSLIKLLVAVYKIIQSMPDINDWCEQVEKDPSSVAPFLEEQFPEYKFEAVHPDSNSSAPSPGMIRVTSQSSLVANIEGCSSRRNTQETDRMNQWISRLQQMGVV